jgi:Zn-dependent protease with chaperone function
MRLGTIIFVLFCIVSLGLVSFAQGTPPPSTATTAQSSPSAPSAPTTAYTLPPDKLEKSKALYDLRGRLRIIGTVWSFVVLLGVLYLGLGARYRDWAEKASRWTFVQAFIVVALLLLTLSILDLPLNAYRHSINLRYGLSVQGWGSWFSDVLKGEAIAIVIATPGIWFLFNRIRKSPQYWWLHTWLVALPFIVFFAVIAPVVIEPMFFKFEPLEKSNPQLVESIEKVTARGGLSIPRDRMFLMKASEKVTELNAYVSGFGPSKRVVVWDTTIQKSTTPETLFVFGHEMGHYVLNHIYYGLAGSAIGLLIGLYLLYRMAPWFLRRFGERWRIRELGDWASLPMIFLIFGILGFLATPVDSAISRQMEHNADVYGLEVTHGINADSQEAGAHAFQVLGELSLDYPYPNKLLVFWYYDHPSIPDRVRFAHEYDPWSKGEQPKYVK